MKKLCWKVKKWVENNSDQKKVLTTTEQFYMGVFQECIKDVFLNATKLKSLDFSPK